MFLQGLLEGIADIEAEAYALLTNLGATPLSKVTCIPIAVLLHFVSK